MRIVIIAVAAVAAVSLSACNKKQVRQAAVPEQVVVEASPDGTEFEMREAAIRNKNYAALGDMQAVHFDYDRYELGEAARAAIRANAAWLKKNPSFEVLVEGHCDERGTVPYNLSLGQKRAAAVRDYYKMLGVRESRMATVSYGNERPTCTEPSEACWQLNRRAVTLGRHMDTAKK